MKTLTLACFVGFAAIGIFASDARAQTYTPISVSSGGTQGNGASKGAILSADDKVVVFSSDATNLVTGDTNGSTDVFVRDLATNTTTRVSVASDGSERTGNSGTRPNFGPEVSLSQDGALVAFTSDAAFENADTNGASDIYVRDRTLNQTSRVSLASDSSQANGGSFDPQISGNGRYVLFSSVASNLVAGDTNVVTDVFLRDRTAQTTTRLSVSSTGGNLQLGGHGGHISANGAIVAFLSDSRDVVSTPDPVACPPVPVTPSCGRAYVLNRSTGEMTRIDVPLPPSAVGLTVASLDLTPDGRFIAMNVGVAPQGKIFAVPSLAVYDRQTGRVEIDLSGGTISDFGVNVAINSSGRMVSADGAAVDRRAFGTRPPLPAPDQQNGRAPWLHFTADGLHFVYSTPETHAAGDTNNVEDVYFGSYDNDNDGMPDYWETQYGLNPNDSADAALDSDGDGVTNLQEYLNGTHPKGTFKRYFAEGAANSFFKTRFGVFNPGTQTANIAFEFLGSNGETRSSALTLASTQSTLILDSTTSLQPDNDFSTIVESDQPIVVDRTMSWDKTGYGSHAETAIEAPATAWYLAEGSTGGAFDLFYLLENPGDMAANVTVNYLRPAPLPPIVRIYPVAPKSRRTIYVDTEDPLLAATDLSAKITSDQPILAERAMYFSTLTQPFAAGHEGAAVTAPALSWFFAEGATGSFFDEYLLLANAETTDAQVQVTYLLPSGAPIVKTYPVSAQSRLTVNVDSEDPRLLDTPVSAIVESKNGVPVVAERAMWWPSPNWYEAHLSAGATTTGTRWALADGAVSFPTDVNQDETYILIANTSNTPGTVQVTLRWNGRFGPTGAIKTFDLPANSRINVQVSVEFPDLLVGFKPDSFGALIESSGPPIVVERAMYSTVNGQTWAAGSDELATKLTP